MIKSHKVSTFFFLQLCTFYSFVHGLGHRYVMQTDDDAFLIEPVLGNLVTHMEVGEKVMAAYYIQKDDSAVMWGLAELAKYFIVTEYIIPTSLFDHCIPHDINGVFSRWVLRIYKVICER